MLCFQAYHEIMGTPIIIHRLEPNNQIPFYFTEVEKIFGVIDNIKHLAMLQTLFYARLRASELCALDDSDLDLRTLSVRIRGDEGERDGMAYITDICTITLHRYLAIRPSLVIDERKPLFYSDNGQRWNRSSLYRMFALYRKRLES